MDREELEHFEALLTQRRAELLRTGDVEIEPVLKDPAEKVDEDAAPLTEMSQVIASRRNQQRSLELERIEQALARLRNDPDEYGECRGCGNEIPHRRLELMPWALFCVACEEKREPARGKRRRHAADYLD